MDYLKDAQNWKPSKFLPPSKKDGRICYIKNNVCFDKQVRRMELNPKWWSFLLIFTLVTIGIIITMKIQELYFGFDPYNVERMVSISYVSGMIGFLAVIYNVQFLRQIALGILPLLIFYLPILYGVNTLYNSGFGSTEYMKCMINHIPHFIIYIILCLDKTKIPHQSMLISALFWFTEISVAFLIFPSFTEFHCLPYLPTILLAMTSIFIMWLILFISQKKRRL